MGVLTTTLSVLREATEDSAIKIVALTGSGDYFSSGNDLSNFLEAEVGKSVYQITFIFFIRRPKILMISPIFSLTEKFRFSEKATKI